jgi:radical SAM superfamily enzyme YgiQ (UPF0313 family)
MRVLFIVDQVDYEPQGIMLLASVLKSAGHEVQLAIASVEDPVAVTAAFRPHVVAYSVITGSQRYYLALNRRIKQHFPNVVSVFGGPHPTFFPEVLLEDGLDGVCVGEGEWALVELVESVRPDGRLERFDIANWHLKDRGEVHRNTVRPYVEDLDSLPSPDYDLIYQKDPVYRRSKIKHFVAGRGCPYDCTYCFNHAMRQIYAGKGRHVRMRSVGRVIEDVLYVRQRYPLEFVVFLDDTFVLNRRWLEEFAAEYPKRVALPFFCNVRPNLVDAELVRLLKAAGCHSVSMGVETADERIREQLLGRNVTTEEILTAAELLRAAGLRFTTTNMIGLPGTGLEQDLQTMELNARCRPDYAYALIFQPYPRTWLGEYARQQGLLEGTIDDIAPRAWDTTILRFPPEHKRALTNLQRLFAVGVEWPALAGLVRRLIALPPNPVYWLIHKLLRGYAIKQRIHPVRMSMRDLLRTAWRFMRLKS